MDYQKALKKVNFIFSLLMGKVIENKWGLELVTSHSSYDKTSSEKSFFSYILSDQV